MNRKGFDEQTWFTFSYSPVRDEAGRVAGMFCACTETTAKVLSERRAVEERERLERMFKQAPGFMAMLSGPEHRFTLTNPAYQHLIGDRDVLGKTVADALPDAVAQGYLEHLDRAFQTGEALIFTSAPFGMQARCRRRCDRSIRRRLRRDGTGARRGSIACKRGQDEACPAGGRHRRMGLGRGHGRDQLVARNV
jgi:PAS domain-containing protein